MLVILIQSFNNEVINLFPISWNHFSRPDLIMFTNKTNEQKNQKYLENSTNCIYRITEFQNHRIVKSVCLMLIGSTSLLKQGHLQPVIQNFLQIILSNSMDGDPSTSLNKLC